MLTGKKRKAYVDAVRVHFTDECRKFGSGVRYVVVERLGPKWVKLIYPANGKTAKLRRSTWDKLTA